MTKRRSDERNELGLPGEEVIKRIIEEHGMVIDDLDLVACLLELHPHSLRYLANLTLHDPIDHEPVRLCRSGLDDYTKTCIALGFELAKVLNATGRWRN